MTAAGKGVLLSDERSSVFLHPPRPYPDGHGHMLPVDIVAGSFRGSIEADSYEGVNVLRVFRDRLAELHRNLTGEARLAPWYHNFRLCVRGDGLGHMNFDVDVMTHDRDSDVRVSFRFAMDQTQLPDVIAAIDRLFAH